MQYAEDMTVSKFDVSHLINQLKCCKAAGSDKLVLSISSFPTINYIYCYRCVSCYCSHIPNFPSPMIETIIVPIVKNKSGILSDSNNYRLATIMSKLFESVILLKCEMFLDTCPNQFGFKKGHSTDMCIYVLKK